MIAPEKLIPVAIGTILGLYVYDKWLKNMLP